MLARPEFLNWWMLTIRTCTEAKQTEVMDGIDKLIPPTGYIRLPSFPFTHDAPLPHTGSTPPHKLTIHVHLEGRDPLGLLQSCETSWPLPSPFHRHECKSTITHVFSIYFFSALDMNALLCRDENRPSNNLHREWPQSPYKLFTANGARGGSHSIINKLYLKVFIL